MEMPVDDGISLLSYAFGKEEDDMLYSRWVGLAQYEISFEEFKKSLAPVRIDEKKTLEKVDKLMESISWEQMPIRSE